MSEGLRGDIAIAKIELADAHRTIRRLEDEIDTEICNFKDIHRELDEERSASERLSKELRDTKVECQNYYDRLMKQGAELSKFKADNRYRGEQGV